MAKISPVIISRIVRLFIKQTPRFDLSELQKFVERFLERRQSFLGCAEQHGSPLYIFDAETLKERARRFRDTFGKYIPKMKIFYALKSNNHPDIISTLVSEGLGLDVSSGLELKMALDSNVENILFSGPGKTAEEITLAIQHHEKITFLMDSFHEMEKLQRLADINGVVVRAGVRLTTDDNGIWRKFGIPLNDLRRLFEHANQYRNIKLRGLQFHLSWNMNADNHTKFITRLAATLNVLPPDYRKQIEFIDIGGGYWPEEGEWLQSAATVDGIIKEKIFDGPISTKVHYKWPSISIEQFAENISIALKEQMPDDMQYTVYLEPGRWLCNDAMHILLKVIDRKADDIVITDGGTNAIGWERFENDYFPVINLTRPGLAEHQCLVAGSLCTPHDIWGYNYFGKDIKSGDILLIPNQGAYTWSLRQNFIKPIPKVVTLPAVRNFNEAPAPITNKK
jgi:diaminopimelate decarboxylase